MIYNVYRKLFWFVTGSFKLRSIARLSSTTMYSGETKEQSYSYATSQTAGSYYDGITSSVLQCVRKILSMRKKEDIQTFSIADFGTADGTRSFPLVEKVLELMNAEGEKEKDIMIYFEDQETNNFNQLFNSLLEKQLSPSPFPSNVFTCAVGKSMYTRCLPRNTLDIIMSTAATHWLSTLPCKVKDGLFHVHADAYELEKIRAVAANDWNDFVLARTKELKPGGYMVVQVMTSPIEGYIDCFGHTSTAWRKLFKEKAIEQDEYFETTLSVYNHRTKDEILAPFQRTNQGNGLVIVSIECKKHEFPGLLQAKVTGPSHYADAIVKFLTPLLRNTIFNGLSKTRSTEDKNKIVDLYFQIVRDMAYNGELEMNEIFYYEVVATKTHVL